MSIFREHKSIADRSATDKSRHKKKIERAIKDSIRDIVAEESIIGQDGKKKIRIPVRGIKEYRFVYGNNSRKVGSAKGKNVSRGQVIGKEKESKKQGGEKAGNQAGEEIYEVEITLEELAHYLFDDLELPDLERKKLEFLSSEKLKRKGYRPKGIRPRLSKRETIKNKIRRQQSVKREKFDEQDEAERFPLHESDLRYRNYDLKKDEITSAVVFFVMDISGSMSVDKKYIARSFYFLLYQFLRHKYDNIEVIFIAHTTDAKEVTEKEFFTLSPNGGTYISPALDLVLEVVEKRFHPSMWNIYTFHCSDGDNWPEDEERAIKSSIKMKEICQLYAFCEISPEGESRHYQNNSEVSPTFSSYIPLTDSKFKTLLLKSHRDIWQNFKKLFGGKLD